MIRVQPGELARLRIHLEALEGMLSIVDRLSEDVVEYQEEDGELEGALSTAYAGLEKLERRSRSELRLEEAIAAHHTPRGTL